jgi:hypothetical protein
MRRLLLPASAFALASCSTLAPIPKPQECTKDEECNLEAGEVCATDTNICLPGRELPPRRHLGFDIQESQAGTVLFHTEVDGCDAEVFLASGTNELRIQRKWYQQRLDVGVLANELEPDTEPTPVDVVPSTLSFAQASRFAYRPAQDASVQYPTLADELTMLLTPTVVRLPRYHPRDELSPAMGDGTSVVWRVVPSEGDVQRASLYRLLQVPLVYDVTLDQDQDKACTEDAQCCIDIDNCEVDPNTCEAPGVCTAIGNPRFLYKFQYQDDCSRSVRGGVDLVSSDGVLSPLVGANVEIVHADEEGEAQLGVFALNDSPPDERDDQCVGDGACAAGEFCDQSQCRLALAGRSAASPRTTDDAGDFEATVYTYADEPDSGTTCDDAVQRYFTAKVSATNSPQPTVEYTFRAPFSPFQQDGIKPPPPNIGNLCLPDWGPPITAELGLSGEPIALVGTGADAFRCCDVGCLPATAEEFGMLAKPPSAETCSGATAGGAFPRAIVEAPATFDFTEDEWDAMGCSMMPIVEDDRIGSLVRLADCSGIDGASCTLTNLGAGPDGSGREYDLRIESPVGSVLQSLHMPIVIDAAGQPAPFHHDITLERRVLVRGTVRVDDELCDPTTAAETDCGSERAIVLAERLRMADEDAADVVGPFFHQVQTFYDPVAKRPGAYVLPLDPGGVYLVTALPAAGSEGGPARFEKVDLRDDVTDRKQDFVLSTGVLVTLDIGTFDTRAAAFTPLDRGSWAGAIPHPERPEGEFVDLNRIGECLTPPEEGPLACKIRRLIPGASLTGSQVGQLRFTARAASEAAATCPEG